MELGFGASGAWGSAWFAEGKASAVIDTALESGIRHFDTAGFYTRGLSEKRLGACLAARRANIAEPTRDIVLATKVGKQVSRRGRLIRDYGAEAIRQQLAASRTRLRCDTLDIVYVHGPNEHELQSSLSILIEQKAEGRIKAIGVCSDGPSLTLAAQNPALDVIMGRYNVLDRRHEDAFRIARETGKKTVAIAVLAQALWRPDFRIPTSLSAAWYALRAQVRARPLLRQASEWRDRLNRDHLDPVEVCLGFVRQCPNIDVALTTTTKPEHIGETAQKFREAPTNSAVTRFLNREGLQPTD